MIGGQKKIDSDPELEDTLPSKHVRIPQSQNEATRKPKESCILEDDLSLPELNSSKLLTFSRGSLIGSSNNLLNHRISEVTLPDVYPAVNKKKSLSNKLYDYMHANQKQLDGMKEIYIDLKEGDSQLLKRYCPTLNIDPLETFAHKYCLGRNADKFFLLFLHKYCLGR